MANRDEINAFLGSGTVYNGDLSFEGAVRIDGAFSGNIVSEGTLIVGHGARLEANIKVGSLVNNGYIKGDVIVLHKAVLHKTAELSGSLTATILIMEEGAQLDGALSMKDSIKTAASVDSKFAGNDENWTAGNDSLQ